ncbi:hypothetical protein P152DRAFT_153760 [Eremomyces bilateralis CBS 781.70]|uniref:Myb-like domain-containing protein n=1 Tax=Eremomyces bilateralis CBS 781.70 TaxID=1392243 RepID=A0A6G1FUV6_9PEZI|nr:uncharacterized protein P152DRAFT_153760 [Eremomyces bilateralis CBS 781.70]KAF1809597.1 hypothetical protein P152DRAFT_153760 [Eremomyces bilateralis CBS 781.70]
MAVTTASSSFDSQSQNQSPDNFRHYSGPSKSRYGADAILDIPFNDPWTDIDDILTGEGLAEPNPTQEPACEAFTGSCADGAILIEDSESDTGSEDELPSLNALFSAGSQPEVGGTPAADGVRDSSSLQVIESGENPPSGQNGELSTGVDMSWAASDLSNYSALEVDVSVADHARISFESLVPFIETAESSSLQPSEETDSIADENHDPAINPSSLEQRKRVRSSSRTTLSTDLDAALGSRSHQMDKQPLEEPRPAKRPRRSRSGEAPPSVAAVHDTGLDCLGRREAPPMFHRVGKERPGSADAETSPQDGDESDAADNRGRARSEHTNRDRSGNPRLASTGPQAAPSPRTIRAYRRRETNDPIHGHGWIGDTADYGRGCGGDTDEEHTVDDNYGTNPPRPPLARRHRGKIQRRGQPFQSNARRNIPTLARDQQIPRCLNSSHPDSSATRSDDRCPQDSDESAPFAMTRHNVTDISLRPTPGDTFLAATIKFDRNIEAISCSTLLTLIENILGHAAKVQDVTLKPLLEGQWLLTGFLRSPCIIGGATTWYETMPNRRKGVASGTAIPVAQFPDSEDDGSISGSDSSVSDYRIDDEKYIDQGVYGRKNRRWEPLEDERLWAYRVEGKSWEWISKQFPGRTPGAVCTRWHTIKRSREGLDETTGS